MGRFIVTRTGEGVRFLLESAGGMALATSRSYKSLDACKKGIASLVADLPCAPLVDATVGERAPNPKIELVARDAGYVFFVKARNGKIVIASPAYATKKAAKRAVSMLRTAIPNATLLFAQEAGLAPLTMPHRGVTPKGGASPRLAVGAETPEKAPCLPPEAPVPDEAPVLDELPVPDEAPIPDEAPVPDELPVPDEASVPDEAPRFEALEIAAATDDITPTPLRFMRVGETRGTASRPASPSTQKPTREAPPTGRSPLLSRILRRK